MTQIDQKGMIIPKVFHSVAEKYSSNAQRNKIIRTVKYNYSNLFQTTGRIQH